MNLIFGITDELEKVTKEKDELAAQKKNYSIKSHICVNSYRKKKLI